MGQALEHKWLADASNDDLGDDLKIFLTNFHHSNKLQQILIRAIVSEMSMEEKKFVIEELKKYKQKRKSKQKIGSNDSLDTVITKESSLISEQEFVEFMISNHVDEKKAKHSTRNLFNKVSPSSLFKTSKFKSKSQSNSLDETNRDSLSVFEIDS